MHQFPQEHSEWKKKKKEEKYHLPVVDQNTIFMQKNLVGGRGGQNEVYVLHVLPAQGKLVSQQVT